MTRACFSGALALPCNLLGLGGPSALRHGVTVTRRNWCRRRVAVDVSGNPNFDVLDAPEKPFRSWQPTNRWQRRRVTRGIASDAGDRLVEICGEFFYREQSFHGA